MLVPISIVIPIIKSIDKIEVWVQKRQTLDSLHGFLEFPGGKIENNETPKQAGVREVLEETGVKLVESKILKFKNYDFQSGDKTILLMVHLFFDDEGLFEKSGKISLQELNLLEKQIPPKNKEILVDLLEYFR